MNTNVKPEKLTLYTVGHSTHEIGAFIGILEEHGITRVIDVRSQPYSKWSPQHDHDALEESLRLAGIAYQWEGRHLGGRPDGAEYYTSDGRVRYDKVAESPQFQERLGAVLAAAAEERVVVMCAEKQPDHCHRRRLIARALNEKDTSVEILHILEDASLVGEEQLADNMAGGQGVLFAEEGWLSANPIRQR